MKTTTKNIKIHNYSIGKYIQDYLDRSELSHNQLAKFINVPTNRVSDIIRGRRSITIDTDLRLCKFFERHDGYFLEIQNKIELRNAKLKLVKEISKIPKFSEIEKTKKINTNITA